MAEPAVAASVEVRMPQMGETVTEGTITSWLKAPGDAVAVDESLLEISTDKVDSEIPSPVAGVLAEIVVPEGETVPIGELLARITTDPPAPDPEPPSDLVPAREQNDRPATLRSGAEQPTAPTASAQPAEQETLRSGAEQPTAPTASAQPAEQETLRSGAEQPTAPTASAQPAEQETLRSGAEQPTAPTASAQPAEQETLRSGAEQPTAPTASAQPAERRRSNVTSNVTATTFLSPAVRTLIDEHGVDPAAIDGSGRDGRVTRDDVLALVSAAPVAAPGVRHVPYTAVRRTIGHNLVASLATAAHTLVVVEVDFARVAPVKERTGLTWLPFVARATIDALADFPLLNAHVSEAGLDVHDEVHLGIAVDLDYEGLVVPVVRDARRLRLSALADAVKDTALAAREHRLAPDDYAGGTFTLTNAGRYGTLLTAPIINQPQAAILSTDGVKVRPVAVPLDDGGHGLAFHPVGNLALSFDHRAFDGAYASAFAARVRDTLEQRDWDEEVR